VNSRDCAAPGDGARVHALVRLVEPAESYHVMPTAYY
jgi:hypothetical protein